MKYLFPESLGQKCGYTLYAGVRYMWQNTVIAIPTGSSHPTPSVSTWLQLQAGGVSGEHRTCGPVLGESVGPSNVVFHTTFGSTAPKNPSGSSDTAEVC